MFASFFMCFTQEVDDADEQALRMFMCPNPTARRTLADIIMEKLTEKQTEIATQLSGIRLLFFCFKCCSLLASYVNILISSKLDMYMFAYAKLQIIL